MFVPCSALKDMQPSIGPSMSRLGKTHAIFGKGNCNEATKLLIVKFEGEEGEGWKPHWLLNLKKNKKNNMKFLIEIIEQL